MSANKNQIEVKGNKYTLKNWNLEERSQVMDKLLLDNQKSVNGQPFISFTTCVLAIKTGTALSDNQINELSTEDLVALGGKVMEHNGKKKVKKSK